MILFYKVEDSNLWSLYVDIQCDNCDHVYPYTSGLTCKRCNTENNRQDFKKLSEVFKLQRMIMPIVKGFSKEEIRQLFSPSQSRHSLIIRTKLLSDDILYKEQMSLILLYADKIILELKSIKLLLS